MLNVNNNQRSWPPPYTIRFSKRAKYISLNIREGLGLEIVVPAFRKHFNIAQILLERKDWVEKNLYLIQQSSKVPSTTNKLPKILPLNAIKEIWHISYIDTNNKNINFIESKYHLKFYGKNKL